MLLYKLYLLTYFIGRIMHVVLFSSVTVLHPVFDSVNSAAGLSYFLNFSLHPHFTCSSWPIKAIYNTINRVYPIRNYYYYYYY